MEKECIMICEQKAWDIGCALVAMGFSESEVSDDFDGEKYDTEGHPAEWKETLTLEYRKGAAVIQVITEWIGTGQVCNRSDYAEYDDTAENNAAINAAWNYYDDEEED